MDPSRPVPYCPQVLPRFLHPYTPATVCPVVVRLRLGAHATLRHPRSGMLRASRRVLQSLHPKPKRFVHAPSSLSFRLVYLIVVPKRRSVSTLSNTFSALCPASSLGCFLIH